MFQRTGSETNRRTHGVGDSSWADFEGAGFGENVVLRRSAISGGRECVRIEESRSGMIRQDQYGEGIPHISVVVPVWRARSLNELCRRLRVSLEGIDESSRCCSSTMQPDESWILIDEQARADKRYVGIHQSRNFGQHPAIAAGLASRGEWVVVMDCDLQDRPEEIPSLRTSATRL